MACQISILFTNLTVQNGDRIFIQNTHLSLQCIFLCNDVLKIYNRTITVNSSHTGEISFIHAYQFTIHIKLNSKNTIQRLDVCSLKHKSGIFK